MISVQWCLQFIRSETEVIVAIWRLRELVPVAALLKTCIQVSRVYPTLGLEAVDFQWVSLSVACWCGVFLLGSSSLFKEPYRMSNMLLSRILGQFKAIFKLRWFMSLRTIVNAELEGIWNGVAIFPKRLHESVITRIRSRDANHSN